ncbi:hypothetical protein SDC9_173994 [bioreactor metagenome]|uniref:Uncharacterized protein n=1 Tax=bioreactor metagenome TaxID=1076179 RepID=A0A645GL38_9ZZZZ
MIERKKLSESDSFFLRYMSVFRFCEIPERENPDRQEEYAPELHNHRANPVDALHACAEQPQHRQDETADCEDSVQQQQHF